MKKSLLGALAAGLLTVAALSGGAVAGDVGHQEQADIQAVNNWPLKSASNNNWPL